MEVLCLKRTDRAGMLLVTLKKHVPAVTLRPIHEILQLYGIFFEKCPVVDQIIKGQLSPVRM